MAKSGGYSSSANQKTNLSKAKFNMKGFYDTAPTVREESNAVRKEIAYGNNPSADSEMQVRIARKQNEVAGIERSQAGRNLPKYGPDELQARKSRLELDLLQQEYNKLQKETIINDDLIDDVYGGVQDSTQVQNPADAMGTPIVDSTPAFSEGREYPTYESSTESPNIGEVGRLDQGPAASQVGGDTLVSPAPLIQALMAVPEDERTPAMWQMLDEIGPQVFDVNTAATRETVDPNNPDSLSRPGAMKKIIIPHNVRMQLMSDSHTMSRLLQEKFDGFAYDNKGVDVQVRREEMLKQIEEGNFQTESVAQFFEGMLGIHETLGQTGAPSALSDVALHAVLHQVREAYKKIGNADDIRGRQEALQQAGVGQSSKDQGEQQFIMGAHESREIGNIILQAMGVKPDPDNVNASIAGGLARDLVVDTFPHLFTRDNNNNVVITQDGLTVSERLLPMTHTILPQTRVQVRFNKKPDISVIKPRSAATIKKSNGKTKKVDYGDYTLVEKTVNLLDNIGYTIDQDLVQFVNILTESMGPDGKTNIDKLIGTGKEDTGQLNRRSGERKKKDPKSGRDIIGPDGEPVMEWYAGDRVKDVVFNDNMDWAQQMANNVIYFDHFVGDNNRFYMKQFIGNFHSHKLPRAMLQSDVKELYNTSNEFSVNELKAGIVKKFGNDLGVKAAAEFFDNNAKKWRSLIMDARENGSAVIDLAAKEDGWSSVSAMIEAVRLLDHIEAVSSGTKIDPIYTSQFLTHVDGTGNGLAHNAMQAGDIQTAALTNMNPFFEAPDGVARMDWAKANPLASDVYHLTGDGMLAQIDANSNESSAFLKQAFVALGLNSRKELRKFSKSPLMIFQYGAGRALIKRMVRENILEMLEDDTSSGGGMLAAFNSVVNEMGSSSLSMAELNQAKQDGNFESFADDFVNADYIIDQMGDMMVKSVETNFPMLKELSNILSSMANAASLHEPPIDLSVITIGGHRMNFGHSNWEANQVRKIIDETSGKDFTPAQKVLYPQGRTVYMSNKQTGKSFGIKSTGAGGKMPTEPNEYYNEDWKPLRGAEIFNPKRVPIGSLKAATQAAVLMTHSLDGINVARSMLAFNEKNKSNSKNVSIAQIFDGFLVSPRHAREFAAQLNQDFKDIHLDKGGKFRTTGNDYNDLNDMDYYIPGDYDFLMNNPNNSNLLLLFRAMAREGFRWDLYKGKGLMDKIMMYEKQRISFREKFKKSGFDIKQFFWD